MYRPSRREGGGERNAVKHDRQPAFGGFTRVHKCWPPTRKVVDDPANVALAQKTAAEYATLANATDNSVCRSHTRPPTGGNYPSAFQGGGGGMGLWLDGGGAIKRDIYFKKTRARCAV